jgi:hypothetical protein
VESLSVGIKRQDRFKRLDENYCKKEKGITAVANADIGKWVGRI